MNKVLKALLFVAMMSGVAQANEFQSELEALAKGKAAEVSASPEVINAVKAQNKTTSAYAQDKIDALDATWRSETEAADQPMIDGVMDNSLSGYLTEVQDGSDGLFTEIFVMDAKGLNVGQSEVTSDYWQGDEAKWQKTFLAGKGAIHIGDLEEDDSTQTLQSQVSVVVVDPDTGEPIGAVTFGVNVEKL